MFSVFPKFHQDRSKDTEMRPIFRMSPWLKSVVGSLRPIEGDNMVWFGLLPGGNASTHCGLSAVPPNPLEIRDPEEKNA